MFRQLVFPEYLRSTHPRRTLLGWIVLALLLSGFFPQMDTERLPFYSDVGVLNLQLETESLSTLIGGKKTFIFYFLPACPHCRDSAPVIAELARTYGTQIAFLGIASARSRLSEIRDYQETFSIPFPIVQDSGTFGQKNNLRSYPQFLLTDGSATPPDLYGALGPDMKIVLEVAITRFLGGNAQALLAPDTYHGSTVCASCHTEEYRSWSLNHHSVAMFSLTRIQKDEDPRCVSCHVVGFGKPGGYVDRKTTPALENVGCEACHGPAGGHNRSLSTEERLARAKLTPEARYGPTCGACHDAEHTIGFDLTKGIPLVGHKHDRQASEVDWLVFRSKVEKNETEKPLLEFPSGEIQGAESCKGCHPVAYQGWKRDGHSRAMATLRGAGKAEDLSCVKCHATLKDKGRPESLVAFQPDVECESCHGPAEAHIKAGGGKGNIVALTRSCPVCVIQALCTSCHNPKEDPDFDLETALKTVREHHK